MSRYYPTKATLVAYAFCRIYHLLRASMSGDRYLGDGATNRHESLHDGIDLSFGQSFSHFGGDIFKGVFIATQLNSTVTYQ